MDREFSQEEITQIARAARVLAPGFSEEQLEALAGSQRQLADSGFIEASWGLVRLQKQMGVPLTQALDAYEQLLRDNVELEEKIARFQAKLQTLEDKTRQAEELYRQIEEATRQARKDQQKMKREREQEEKRLIAFKKKAETEKERIKQEVEECRRRAGVTEEEVAAAGQLKAEVAKCGFSIEFTLDLCQEFAGYENAREELARALGEHGALTRSNAALAEEQERGESDLLRLQGEQDRVARNRTELEAASSHLRAEISGNKEILEFYHRYLGLRPFMEYLGGWNSITFHHCAWCGALFLIAPGKTRFKGVFKCPWCGLGLTEYDRQAYVATGFPIGASLKLLPGG